MGCSLNRGIKLFKNFLKEPLLHFLIVGGLLFVIFEFLSPKEFDDTVIQVGDDELLGLILSRDPRLDQASAAKYLGLLDGDLRDQLTEDYIREEVMFREAISLGLDQNSYTARRRLIAQLEYVNQGFIYDALELTEEELGNYFNQNRDRYAVPAKVTFTHVFFSQDFHADSINDLAEAELTTLNNIRLPFHLAASRGDHFLYHRNYVNKNEREIASHFGSSFASKVFGLEQEEATWRGPLKSEYGVHLILLTTKNEGYLPDFDQVKARLIDDVTQIRVRDELDRLYGELRKRYRVKIQATNTDR